MRPGGGGARARPRRVDDLDRVMHDGVGKDVVSVPGDHVARVRDVHVLRGRGEP